MFLTLRAGIVIKALAAGPLDKPHDRANNTRMPTISSPEQLGHVDSRQIAIAAPREAVISILADATRLPDWAPNFARAVQRDGEHWRVDTGAGDLLMEVVVDRDLGTVDLIRPGDPSLGAKMRVLHNGAGSAFVFSIVFPPGAPEEAIVAQMATIEEELVTVRGLAEAAVVA
jgi:hypothetical protein